MRDLGGKTAFVTGGASGIGLALGRAFVDVGMNVVLADIEAAALAEVVDSLRTRGGSVRGVACDVADAADVERGAAATFEAFGCVHVVCNNAGVAGGSGIDDISVDTWRWVLDVNFPPGSAGAAPVLRRTHDAAGIPRARHDLLRGVIY